MANGNGVSKWLNVPNVIGSLTIILLVWAGNGISQNKENVQKNININATQDKDICANTSDIKELKTKQASDHDSLITLAGEIKTTNALLKQISEKLDKNH